MPSEVKKVKGQLQGVQQEHRQGNEQEAQVKEGGRSQKIGASDAET
tara:strand:+ start:237 stop:374 length:138 start_codon:yes stop_codon:yes gene_type:complete